MRHGVQSLRESWCRAECASGRTQDERGPPKAMAVASFCAPDIGRTPFRVSRTMVMLRRIKARSWGLLRKTTPTTRYWTMSPCSTRAKMSYRKTSGPTTEKPWNPSQCLYFEQDESFEALVREKRTPTEAIIELAADFRSPRHNVWGITARNREQELCPQHAHGFGAGLRYLARGRRNR